MCLKLVSLTLTTARRLFGAQAPDAWIVFFRPVFFTASDCPCIWGYKEGPYKDSCPNLQLNTKSIRCIHVIWSIVFFNLYSQPSRTCHMLSKPLFKRISRKVSFLKFRSKTSTIFPQCLLFCTRNGNYHMGSLRLWLNMIYRFNQK